MLARPKTKSPCVQICMIDPSTGLCEGCFRSLAEIGGWMRYSAEERDRVLAALPGRRRAAPARRESAE